MDENLWINSPIRVYISNIDDAVSGRKREFNEKEKEYVLHNCIKRPIRGKITLKSIIKANIEKWVFDEEYNFAGVIQNGIHVCRDGIVSVPDKKYLLYSVNSADLDLTY